MLSLGNFLKERLNRRLNVFLVCLFISAVIWVLNALSKSYSTNIVFPVEHHGVPDDRIVTDPPPASFSLEVRSHGFQLLAYKLFSRQDPIKVDLSQLHYLDQKKRRKGYLLTEELLEDLSRQFPEKTRIRNVEPDTLFVSLAPLEKKKVEVVPDLEFEFREQYRLAQEVTVTPPKVTLSGPSSVLDTTEMIRTQTLRMKDVHQDQQRTVELRTDSISKKVDADPSKVELRIQVDEFTEGNATIPISAKEVPEKYSIKTYPDSITVHYLVSFKNYEKVERDMFKAIVRFPEDKGMKERDHLQVALKDHPSFIDIVRYEPRRVEFIIRRKK